MLGTLIALVWANVERESYMRVAQYLHFPINDRPVTVAARA